MKLNRPHISHKTDKGFVQLDLKSPEDVVRTFEDFRHRCDGEPLEVMLQPMVYGGREVILGGRQDEVFGPVILFGLGGVFVEALGDVIWRVAPIAPADARSMIYQIRGRKLLTGTRGQSPSDLAALESMLMRISAMLVNHPEIREIDINPVRVAREKEGAYALDARVILQHGP